MGRPDQAKLCDDGGMIMFAFATGLLIGSLAGVFVTCACKAAGWSDKEENRRDRREKTDGME